MAHFNIKGICDDLAWVPDWKLEIGCVAKYLLSTASMSVFLNSILSDGTTVLGNCVLGTDLQQSRSLLRHIVPSPLRELDNVYSGPHGDDFRALVIGLMEDICETEVRLELRTARRLIL
jgi:hypothetical protein